MLNTGFDNETLAICVRLCEKGIIQKLWHLLLKRLRNKPSTYRLELRGQRPATGSCNVEGGEAIAPGQFPRRIFH